MGFCRFRFLPLSTQMPYVFTLRKMGVERAVMLVKGKVNEHEAKLLSLASEAKDQ